MVPWGTELLELYSEVVVVLYNKNINLKKIIKGVSRVSRVFEQHEQVSVIGEVGKAKFEMHFLIKTFYQGYELAHCSRA